MKCINKPFSILCAVLLSTSLLTGCGSDKIAMSYKVNNGISAAKVENKADGFSANLAVTNDNVAAANGASIEEMSAGGLFDVNNSKVLYAQNIHDKKFPASLTKVLTAVVAMKYSNMDDVITCSENVTKLESGASTCGLKPGDQLTMNQALHFLLLPSANDAAVAIAEHISGSVEEFAELMNKEAVNLGATNSHFVNPHGLNNEDHYSTAYDIYLITNEAIKYELFNEIISTTSYDTVITDKNGGEKKISVKSSNKFLDGSYSAPDSITVIGGKTGTTSAAGSCLVLVTKDASSNPYISVIMKATERDLLYQEMISILEDIN